MQVLRRFGESLETKTNTNWGQNQSGGGNLLVSHDGHNQHDDPHHNEDNMEVVLDVGM